MTDTAVTHQELKDAAKAIATEMHSEFSDIRRLLGDMNTAFTVDDLGRPDYNGHRLDHKARIDQARVLETYKTEAAKKVIGVVVVFLLGIMSSGIMDWVRHHVG